MSRAAPIRVGLSESPGGSVKSVRSIALLVAVCCLAGPAAAEDTCNVELRPTILVANVPNRIIIHPLFPLGSFPSLFETDGFPRRKWTATPVGVDGAVRIDSDTLSSEELQKLFSQVLPFARIARDPYFRAHGSTEDSVEPSDPIFRSSIDPHWWFHKVH